MVSMWCILTLAAEKKIGFALEPQQRHCARKETVCEINPNRSRRQPRRSPPPHGAIHCGAPVTSTEPTCPYCKQMSVIMVRGTRLLELVEMYVETENHADADGVAKDVLKEHPEVFRVLGCERTCGGAWRKARKGAQML